MCRRRLQRVGLPIRRAADGGRVTAQACHEHAGSVYAGRQYRIQLGRAATTIHVNGPPVKSQLGDRSTIRRPHLQPPAAPLPYGQRRSAAARWPFSPEFEIHAHFARLRISGIRDSCEFAGSRLDCNGVAGGQNGHDADTRRPKKMAAVRMRLFRCGGQARAQEANAGTVEAAWHAGRLSARGTAAVRSGQMGSLAVAS